MLLSVWKNKADVFMNSKFKVYRNLCASKQNYMYKQIHGIKPHFLLTNIA